MTRSVICDMVCATLLCTCLLGAPAFAQSPAQPLAQAEHPVFAAVQRGDISALERLLKESRDKRLANARNAEGEPLLYVAAESGSVDLVGVVLEAGADVNGRSENGETALHAAGMQGSAGVATLLLEKGANPELANRDGERALYWAAATGTLEVVKVLLDKGVALNVQDVRGNTALHGAADGGHAAVVKLLLEKKANALIRNREGLLPAGIARAREHKEVEALLLQ